MGGPYYVDDGGNNSDGLTWAKAFTSIQSLDTAVALASGEIVYFGHDSNCTDNGADLTITGPATGLPVIFISVTQGSDPPTYAVGTGDQIHNDSGAYYVYFDGSFAMYGIRTSVGGNIRMVCDDNEHIYTENCKFVLGANCSFSPVGANSLSTHINTIIDLTADGTTVRTQAPLNGLSSGITKISGMTFVAATYRTGTIISIATLSCWYVSNCDFSGFTHATTCEIATANGSYGTLLMNNCRTKATPTYFLNSTLPAAYCRYEMYACANEDDPTNIQVSDYVGALSSSKVIYRTGGATVEAEATAWLVTTFATASVDSPYYTPWIYGTIASTGDKTFTVYITNDTADFNNDEVWLEVEYMDTADVGLYTLVTDKPTARTTAAAAQADDAASTWNGTGPSFTYKQSLHNTATANVSETGQFRARVAVGKASIAAASFFYIDPKVTVS